MSRAPLPSLRSFWALGGAPTAFVHRDERLRESLERVVATAERSVVLAEGNAYARLVAGFSFADVLPGEVAAAPTSDAREEGRRSARTVAWPEVGSQRAGAGRAASGTAGASSTAAAALRASLRAPAAAAGSAGGRSSMFGDAGDVTPAGAQRWGAPGVVPGRHRSVLDVAMLEQPRRRSSGFTEPSPPPATWTEVPAVRSEPDPVVAARVAALLSATRAAAPRALQVAVASGAAADDARGEAVAGLALLARTVQRVERHIAERSSRDRTPAADLDERGAPGRAFGTTDRVAPRPPRVAAPIDDAPRLGGLRGLAARAGTAPPRRQRAPMLVPPNESVHDWPDGDVDAFATMLDDAARRNGIDVGEVAP